MKPFSTSRFLTLIVLFTIASIQTFFSQVTYTWNGTTSNDWSVGSNWTPLGPPTNVDHAIIVAAPNVPTLVANTPITNITMTSGSLNLGGFTLTTTGNQTFTAGTVSNGTLSSISAGTSLFTNTTFAADATINLSSNAITINGGTFNGTTSLNVYGTGNTTGTGNATFNGTTNLSNSGTGFFRTNGNMTFNGSTNFTLSGSGDMLFELTSGSIYNGPLTLTLAPTATAQIRMGYQGTTNYNNTITFNNQSVTNIRFGELGASVNNFNVGNTLQIGTVSSGAIIFNRFTQLGATPQNLTTTGTALVQITNSTFNAPFTLTSPQIVIGTSTFMDDVVLTKTSGVSTNNCTGNNVFNGTTTINYTSTVGTGYFGFGLGGPDTFNDDVFINNNSLDRIIMCHNSIGNQFNGNVSVSQIGSSVGTALTWGPGTASIAATNNLSIGGAGYSVGYLYTQNVTQLGSEPINLTLTGTGNIFLGPNANFGGDFSVTAPNIYARGAIYQGDVIFTKTGAGDDHNNGQQNIFNGTVEIRQQSTGYFMLGYNSNDQFMEDITVSSTNTGGINLGWVNGTGTPTLAAGKTILVGAAGYTQGQLRLGSFTQLGNAPISLNLDGANFLVHNIPASTNIGGNFTLIASNITLEGGTFNGLTTLTKTGAGNNTNGSQQNIFNDDLEINLQGTGNFTLGSNSNDQFFGNITVTNTSTGILSLGAGTGTPTMSAGNTILIGGAGFNTGSLYLIGFTQLGNVPMNLTLGNTTRLDYRNSSIGGDLTSTSGRLFFIGNTFNGTVNIEKTGASDDQSAGGNTFSQVTEIENSGTGYILTANGNPDIYNNHLTLINSGSSTIYFGYNSTGNSINGDFTVQNTGSSLQMRILDLGSTLTVTGNTTLLNSSNNASTQIYYPLNGVLTQTGDVTGNNTTTGNVGQIIISNSNGSQLNLTGNLSLSNTSSASNNSNFIGAAGNVAVSGNLIFTNNSTGLVSNFYMANGATSTVTIGGTSLITNNGGGTTKNGIIGGDGNCVFNSDLTIENNANATNSIIRCNNGVTSVGQYNGNIVITNSDASGQGIRFGESNGSGTLAATRTITIGAGGFVAGNLTFRNFTQVGPTAQTLLTTGTTRFENFNSNWGGDVQFSGAQMYTRGTTYGGTSYLEKYGTTDDASVGGNTFVGDCELRNTGSRYFLMGNGVADTWGGDLVMNNMGTFRMYLAHNSAGNSIAGNLTLNNTGTGTDNDNYFMASASASLAIGGNLTINNTSSATTNANIYFSDGNLSSATVGGDVVINNNTTSAQGLVYLGNNGSVTITGNLTSDNIGTSTNGQVLISNGANSFVTIGGSTLINNLGAATTRRTFLGNNGDITCTGDLTINNSSSATNSEVYCNNGAASVGIYNGNIVVSNSDAAGDGVRFGESNGSGTLAATRTITIGAGGFVSGLLYFRNFTQVGPTAQTLVTTGTTHFENFNSNWGGDVIFTGARMYTRGTTYNGTSYLEKYGANDDASVGGNNFIGNCELRNSGSRYFLMGNGVADTWGGDLLLNNTGTYWMYLAHNSAGNSIAGNLTINNTATGNDSRIYLINTAASTLNLGGNLTVSNNASSTTTANIYYGDAGNGTIGGDVLLSNNSSAVGSIIYLGNTGGVDVTGNVTANNISTGTNSAIYLATGGTGTSTYGGNVIINNNPSGTTGEIYVANGASRAVTINGTTDVTNSGGSTTRRVYLGNAGDITFNNTLTINNSSSATNSEVYCNNGAASQNLYQENIILTNTNAAGDGVLFGNGGGSGTLAATKTVTIGGGGFVAGFLYFRNFTQVGATAQTLHPTGTTHFENFNSNWGGDVSFMGARMFTRGTTYQGTSYLEKFGAGSDGSVGGNTFQGTCELRNSGSGFFMMGNGVADSWVSDLTMNNMGTNLMYLAYASTGNTIGGDLTVNNTGNGADNSIYFTSTVASTLAITGNVILNNLVTGTGSNIGLPDVGTASIGGTLTGINNGSGANSQILLANGGSSSLTIGGATNLTNSGAGTTKRTYVGNAGDITFNGDLTIVNNSTATNSEVFLNFSPTSANAYNENIILSNTNALSDGIFFGNNNGNGTLAANKTVTIGAGGFSAGTLQFRNFTQLSNTAQAITLTGLSTIFENYSSTWNGDVTFISPRHFTRGTTYNGVNYLEKNGAVNDPSVGGNIFNGNVEFVVSGTGYFMPANGTGNDFNANVTYTKTSSGLMYPTYNSTSTYAGDITINSNTVITFGELGNGRVEFDGNINQFITNTGSASNHIISRITTNKSGGEVILNTPIVNRNNLNLLVGNVVTDAVNLLTMNAGSNVSAVSDAAYVSGPLRKIGNTAFTFPIGKGGFYRPAGISAPGNVAHHFTAEYFGADPHNTGYLDTQKDPTLLHISDCEYWTIDRTNGASNVFVTLSFKPYTGVGCSGVTDPTTLKVARWDGSTWKDHGNGGTIGTTSGTVQSAAVITAFSPFTLSTTDQVANPLPIELVSFDAQPNGNSVDVTWQTASEINNDYFTVEKSSDGVNFEFVAEIDGAGNSTSLLSYATVDENPYNGQSFYRLKQTDFDGSFEYSNPVVVNFNSANLISIYPNPVLGNNQRFTIDYTNLNETVSSIQMIDELGRIVYSQTANSNNQIIISTENLGSGVYFVKVITTTNQYISKVVIK
jgi:hypothetical protein